jgi:L-asparagine transporter-like permease
MRNWFVGLLFAIGTLLYVNQGHSRKEDVALSLAGLLAVGTSLFPMPWDCFDHFFSPHGFCAISFFVCIAFVSGVCSNDTLELIKDLKVRARYRKTYIALAIAMIASLIAAYVFNFITSQRSPVYWAELFGICAFAAYWCVKTMEMSGPDIKRILAEKRDQPAI